jgi:hypothetical protein
MKVHNLEKSEDAETVDPTVEYNKLRTEITLLDPPEGMGDDFGHGEATFGHLMGGYDAGKFSVALLAKAEANFWKDTMDTSGLRYLVPTCFTRRSRNRPWMAQLEGGTDTQSSRRVGVGKRWTVLRSSLDASQIVRRSLKTWDWGRRSRQEVLLLLHLIARIIHSDGRVYKSDAECYSRQSIISKAQMKSAAGTSEIFQYIRFFT